MQAQYWLSALDVGIFTSSPLGGCIAGALVAGYQLSIVIGILAAYCSNWLILRAALAGGDWLAGLRFVLLDEP